MFISLGRQGRADVAKQMMAERQNGYFHVQLPRAVSHSQKGKPNKGTYLHPIYWARVPIHLKAHGKEFLHGPNAADPVLQFTPPTAADPSARAQESPEPTLCSICLQAEANAQLLPCEHSELCRDCLLLMLCAWPNATEPSCPLCREPIEAMVFFN